MEETIEKYIEEAKDALQEIGPEAAEVTLTVFRFQAIEAVARNLLVLPLIALGVYLCYRFALQWRESEMHSDRRETWCTVTWISGGLTVILAIIFVGTFQLAAWAGMVYPEVYFVHVALGRI